jgi:hypothetical protein
MMQMEKQTLSETESCPSFCESAPTSAQSQQRQPFFPYVQIMTACK